MGIEPITPTLQKSVASLGTCQPVFVRGPRWKSNPVSVLTMDVCCRNTYRPSSDPGRTRAVVFLAVAQVSSPLDYGIALKVTEVGVEPTGTRPSTSSLCQFAYSVASGGSGCCTRRARLMRPHWALAHPRSSCRSRYRAGHAGLMRAGWAPAAPAMMSSQGESRTPTPRGHNVLNVACLPVPPLGCGQ